MGKLIETRFTVDEAFITSEFGYCWLTRAEVKLLYILNLDGNFEIEREQKSGRLCIQSKEELEPIETEELGDYSDSNIRKQFNLGKIKFRPIKPNAYIEIPASYLKHIWELCNSDKYKVTITLITEESALEVREVSSILVETDKREVNKKRGFFG